MLNNKKIALLGIFFLLLANSAQAFEQDYTPEDPGLVYQGYLDLINVQPSWSSELQVNKEVVVAVLDSGVDMDHPDLVENIWANDAEVPGDGIDNDKNSYIDDVNGWDFVDSDNNPEPDLVEGYDYTAINHGTVVSGVIAATANQQGIVGIAPQAKIMPLKILDEKGVGNTLVLSQAIKYAVDNGADIINLSLVGDSFDKTLEEAITDAYHKGVMIVAASGNETDLGIDLDVDPRYPVCDMSDTNQVLGVAAVDNEKVMTEFTNFGEQCIDISAPGRNFYSTAYNDLESEEFQTYYEGGWNGTSVAAPTVSATAALIKMHYPELRPYDIYNILKASASDLRKTNPFNHLDLGDGLLDVGAALELAEHYHNDSAKIILGPQRGRSPEILVLDDKGILENTFLAYAADFYGGVNVAVGDVDGDGKDEIVTAPMAGGGPHIRVFERGGNLIGEFFAYAADFYGGVNVAVGDVDGDGKDEIVTAPMAGGGPHIRVFDYNGKAISEFFAYENSFDGGVNVALGDVNNDHKDEIVVAPASKRIPEVRVYNYQNILKSKFLAYEESVNQGVNLSIGDVNNDNWQEIVTVPAKGYAAQVKMFNMRGRLKSEFLAYSQYLTTGVKVIAKDISGDLLPEVLTLPNRGSAAFLKIYDSLGLEKDSFYLRNTSDRNGYSFDILAR